jgi:hypothetical protein
VDTAVRPQQLAPLASLNLDLAALVAQVCAAGIEPIREPLVSRLDVAVNCRFVEGHEGQALLATLGQTPLGNLLVRREGLPTETVTYLRASSREKVLVIYDKGIEQRAAPRGELVRVEAREHWTGANRVPVGAVTEELAARLFSRRVRPLAGIPPLVHVAGPSEALRQIAPRAAAGGLSVIEFEEIAGALAVQLHGLEYDSASTAGRRRKLLRSHGLPPASEAYRQTSFAVREVIRSLVEAVG